MKPVDFIKLINGHKQTDGNYLLMPEPVIRDLMIKLQHLSTSDPLNDDIDKMLSALVNADMISYDKMFRANDVDMGEAEAEDIEDGPVEDVSDESDTLPEQPDMVNYVSNNKEVDTVSLELIKGGIKAELMMYIDEQFRNLIAIVKSAEHPTPPSTRNVPDTAYVKAVEPAPVEKRIYAPITVKALHKALEAVQKNFEYGEDIWPEVDELIDSLPESAVKTEIRNKTNFYRSGLAANEALSEIIYTVFQNIETKKGDR